MKNLKYAHVQLFNINGAKMTAMDNPEFTDIFQNFSDIPVTSEIAGVSTFLVFKRADWSYRATVILGYFLFQFIPVL